MIDGRHEWLLVRETGRSMAITHDEIEIADNGEKALFGFPDEHGFRSVRLVGCDVEGHEIRVEVAGAFGRNRETLRLIPRTSASELTAEVELARLQRANEIGRHIADGFTGAKVERIALNKENGRTAQIIFTRDKRYFGAMADVTATLTPETLIASAMLWHEKLGNRKKKPVLEIWIICEVRQARAAQKLHALLTARWKNIVTILEISRKTDPPGLITLQARKLSDLWREKAKRLVMPADAAPSETATAIIKRATEKIDIVYSKQGETLRFLGLPFARVRTMLGKEKAWFGTSRNRQILTPETAAGLDLIVSELETHRRPSPPNTRHELFRTSPEAWLESILRRNIKLLDANLILAPIYNQFRSSNDKIDLLALRGDGRLVIIELKTGPDREMIFQAADYWRKIELQRRHGVLADADLFDGREIIDKPALVYLAAPAWSFHRDFAFFARALRPEIEIWRFELHQDWRRGPKVVGRVGPEVNP